MFKEKVRGGYEKGLQGQRGNSARAWEKEFGGTRTSCGPRRSRSTKDEDVLHGDCRTLNCIGTEASLNISYFLNCQYCIIPFKKNN